MELEQKSMLAEALGTRHSTEPVAGSTRRLLTTILGEFVLPAGGSAWTQTLVSALGLVEVKEKAARQTIARMHEQGWLERRPSGRQTAWSLTLDTADLLEVGAERIYGFGNTTTAWDGRWVVLMASVPETDRGSRYRMNLGLRWAGFGSLGQGAWISPWTEREADAVRTLKDLGVEGTSFVASLGQLGDGSKLAAEAWDLPSLRRAYETFLSETEGIQNREAHEADAVIELTKLVHRWRQFPFVDPDLPLELLPNDWPGTEASLRFGELRAQLLQPATAWWRTTEASFSPRSS